LTKSRTRLDKGAKHRRSMYMPQDARQNPILQLRRMRLETCPGDKIFDGVGLAIISMLLL
jgi:hypothetical protein